MKEPGIAALLNFVPGLGYLYIDKKRVLGWCLVVATVLSVTAIFAPTSAAWAAFANASMNWGDYVGSLSGAVLYIGVILDAYLDAERVNSRQAAN
jgi:hypothetical protein